MICPILSQSSRDNDGNVVWDHHECVENACIFWADAIRDCGIRASGLALAGRAEPDRPAAGADGPAKEILSRLMAALDRSGAAARETGLKLLEGVAALEEPLKATGREVSRGLESLNASVLSVSTAVEGRLSRLEEGMGALRKAHEEASASRPAYLSELDASLASLTGRLGDIAGRFAALSERLESVCRKISGLRDAHEEISTALAREAQRRKEEDQRRRKEEAMSQNARGVGLYHRGAAEAAERTFRAALELDPGLAEAHNNLGLALSKQGRDAEAEGCFVRALEIDPGLAEATNNLGFLFHRGMQFEKAVEMFRRSAIGAQDSSVAYTNLGNACYKLGRYSEAVGAWRRALEANPLNESAKKALRMFQQDEAAGT